MTKYFFLFPKGNDRVIIFPAKGSPKNIGISYFNEGGEMGNSSWRLREMEYLKARRISYEQAAKFVGGKSKLAAARKMVAETLAERTYLKG